MVVSSTEAISRLRKFSSLVSRNQESLTPRVFKEVLSETFGRDLKYVELEENFLREYSELAGSFAKDKGTQDFTGIMYDVVLKAVPISHQMKAQMGFGAYDFAMARGDYIHAMSFANMVRGSLKNVQDKDAFYLYLQALYKQEKALKKIGTDYAGSVKNFATIDKTPRLREDYMKMLAFVQTDIAKITWRKHPHDAQRKLLSARAIYSVNPQENRSSLEYIDRLLSDINGALVEGAPANVTNLNKG